MYRIDIEEKDYQVTVRALYEYQEKLKKDIREHERLRKKWKKEKYGEVLLQACHTDKFLQMELETVTHLLEKF